MNPDERLELMRRLADQPGGQLRMFFTAHSYGHVYDAPKLEYSSKANRIAAVVSAAQRNAEEDDLLRAAQQHFGLTDKEIPIRKTGEQARQVRAWLDLFVKPPILQAVNNSDAPLRDIVPGVSVFSEASGALLGGSMPMYKVALAELPPFQAFAWRLDHLSNCANDTSAKSAINLEFTDAMGKRWRLDDEHITAIEPLGFSVQYVPIIRGENSQPIDEIPVPEEVQAEVGTSGERSVFLSYVREDEALVERLYGDLTAAGIKVWRDKDDLAPGDDWKAEIHRVITKGSFTFVPCFSEASLSKRRSYMNEELSLALDELRLRPNTNWFIPVLLSPVELPDWDIGRNRRLGDIHQSRLFENWDRNIKKLISVIRRLT